MIEHEYVLMIGEVLPGNYLLVNEIVDYSTNPNKLLAKGIKDYPELGDGWESHCISNPSSYHRVFVRPYRINEERFMVVARRSHIDIMKVRGEWYAVHYLS